MASNYAGVGTPARRISPELVMAGIKVWCFRLIKALIGLGYIVLICDGLRLVVPALGMKLYNMPFLGALRNYEGWHELDLAPFAAVLLFLFSSSIWGILLEAWLYDDSSLQAIGRSSERYQRCLGLLGGVILFADACLFYRALTLVGWSGNAFSLTALFSACSYLAVLVSVCMVSVNLKRNYLSLKRGLAPYGASDDSLQVNCGMGGDVRGRLSATHRSA